MSNLQDTKYEEVFMNGIEEPAQGAVVSRDQVEGSIKFTAGPGMKNMLTSPRSKLLVVGGGTVADMIRRDLHERLDRWIEDEISK